MKVPALKFMGVAAAVCPLSVFLAFAALACPTELPFISVTVKDRPLLVEVAATPSARECGLSRRKNLPAEQGMLFVYPSTQPLSFWMKDTRIPLSIAFLDETGRILSIQNMVPMQINERYRSPQPSRYALEVNQGWFSQHGIEIGDVVHLEIPQVLEVR